ncbi:MAG: CPBP family intramembrane metalloprotease [Gemmatimonadaceae bacterium]|nr:CPBP family intramembrane metalloprotease [Gemmatimonadaceae bacterium]
MRTPGRGQGDECAAAPANECAPPVRSPLNFFGLVFALSVPFWLAGAVSDLQLMPGLSVSALMTFCPMAAALILVHREGGGARVAELLSRSFDFERIRSKRWYIPVLFLMAGVNLAVYGVMVGLGMPLPSPQIQLTSASLMFVAFFAGALGEELGWSGYITGQLQRRWNALQTGLILALVAVLWHLPALLLVHRSPRWIAWWCLYAVAARILIVWLFNNTGQSVCAVALFHATLNLSYMLFPVYGSHFDMRIAGVIMVLAAAIVIAVWQPDTLARRPQFSRPP